MYFVGAPDTTRLVNICQRDKLNEFGEQGEAQAGERLLKGIGWCYFLFEKQLIVPLSIPL